MMNILFPAQELPVSAEVDVVVAGGSCTGVFAAITAARGGAAVAIVESQNRFGGTATAGQVCLWHSLLNFDYSRQIIFGLTPEILERMDKRDLVEYWKKPNPHWYANFNSEEMCCELDEMVLEAGIIPFLHTRVAGVWQNDNGKIGGLVIAGKDGLTVIKARYIIDATGDGDVVRFAGGKMWKNEEIQTSTACVKFSKFPREVMHDETIGKLVRAAKEKYRMPCGVIWGEFSCNSDTFMLAGTNIPKLDVSVQKELTEAEMESRRQMRAIADILKDAGYPRPVMEAVPSLIGVRESRHIVSLYRITEDELLSGKQFPDEAGKGTYRSDVHRRNPPGTRFRYLDGTEVLLTSDAPPQTSYWRDPSLPTPEYFTWPIRSQIPVGFDNLITAGRMIDADAGAFGALRVMVNMNQSGEAAARLVLRAMKTGTTLPSAAASGNL